VIAVADADSAGVTPDLGGQKEKTQTGGGQRSVLQRGQLCIRQNVSGVKATLRARCRSALPPGAFCPEILKSARRKELKVASVTAALY
jgi:hypothetical protein